MPLFPLVLVVILAGLLLGGVFAHFFGSPRAPSSAPTAIAALASPTPTPVPIFTASPTAAPASTPSARAKPLPSTAPKATRRPAKTPAKILTPAPTTSTPTETPTPTKTPAPTKTPTPTKTSTVLGVVTSASPISRSSSAPPAASVTVSPLGSAQGRASAVVRSYLQALSHGDRATAATYLAHGLPSETFMNPDAHIESIRSANIGAQQYRVTADVQTTSGEYYVTFTVENGPLGLQITDHYAIKPQ